MSAGFDGRLCLAVLYTGSASACMLADACSRVAARDFVAPSPAVWRVSAILLLAMAVNGLLRIDMVFVSWLRALAVQSDWYASRRPLQLAVLLLLLYGVVFRVHGGSQDAWAVESTHFFGRSGMLNLGLGLLLILTAMRFVSLHHTDQILDWRVGGLRFERLAELAGLGLVLLASVPVIARRG